MKVWLCLCSALWTSLSGSAFPSVGKKKVHAPSMAVLSSSKQSIDVNFFQTFFRHTSGLILVFHGDNVSVSKKGHKAHRFKSSLPKNFQEDLLATSIDENFRRLSAHEKGLRDLLRGLASLSWEKEFKSAKESQKTNQALAESCSRDVSFFQGAVFEAPERDPDIIFTEEQLSVEERAQGLSTCFVWNVSSDLKIAKQVYGEGAEIVELLNLMERKSGKILRQKIVHLEKENLKTTEFIVRDDGTREQMIEIFKKNFKIQKVEFFYDESGENETKRIVTYVEGPIEKVEFFFNKEWRERQVQTYRNHDFLKMIEFVFDEDKQCTQQIETYVGGGSSASFFGECGKLKKIELLFEEARSEILFKEDGSGLMIEGLLKFFFSPNCVLLSITDLKDRVLWKPTEAESEEETIKGSFLKGVAELEGALNENITQEEIDQSFEKEEDRLALQRKIKSLNWKKQAQMLREIKARESRGLEEVIIPVEENSALAPSKSVWSGHYFNLELLSVESTTSSDFNAILNEIVRVCGANALKKIRSGYQALLIGPNGQSDPVTLHEFHHESGNASKNSLRQALDRCGLIQNKR